MGPLKRTLSGCSSSKVSKKQHLDPTLDIFSGMSRTIVEECGIDFLPADGEKACEILKNISLLRWESFVKNPGGYVKEIVLEFYENLDKEKRTSTVRGKVINFNSEVLNELYSLSDIDDEEIRVKMKTKNFNFMKEAVKSICPNGVKIITGTLGTPKNIACSCMSETARTWGKFVSSRLIPYVNVSNYDKKRVMLIYATQQNLPINVGRIIGDGMIKCRFKDRKCLYFPSTITRLARRFEVPMDNLVETENTYLVEYNFLSNLVPPHGPDLVADEYHTLESPMLIEAEKAENVGTSSSPTSTDTLVYLQQILQEQAAMRKNWDIFANTQAVIGAKMERVMLELADTKNGQNFIRQTLQNHVSYTSPTMCSMENFLNNFSNAIKCFNNSNFQPHPFTGPGSSSFPDAGTGWCQIPQLSISMPLPSLDPMPFSTGAFFSDVTTISEIATSSIPIHFFNEGPSDAIPHMEKSNFDMDLDFFHHGATGSSGY